MSGRFRGRTLVLLALFPALTAGCSTTAAVIGGAVGGTAALSRSPTSEIAQVYYLGVFDPVEQVPPQVYRVTVHGQASALSFTKYASGWVPAAVADGLSTSFEVDFDEDNQTATLKTTTGDSQLSLRDQPLQTGRRLMMLGPEGFRSAPKNHRLVIVMGSSPEGYFEAVDKALGVLGAAQAQEAATGTAAQQGSLEASQSMSQDLLKVQSQQTQLNTLMGGAN